MNGGQDGVRAMKLGLSWNVDLIFDCIILGGWQESFEFCAACGTNIR